MKFDQVYYYWYFSIKCLVKKHSIFFGVEFFSDKFFIERFCVEFHEFIVLAFVLKRPYFWVQNIRMLRWSFTDQQMLGISRFSENVKQS